MKKDPEFSFFFFSTVSVKYETGPILLTVRNTLSQPKHPLLCIARKWAMSISCARLASRRKATACRFYTDPLRSKPYQPIPSVALSFGFWTGPTGVPRETDGVRFLTPCFILACFFVRSAVATVYYSIRTNRRVLYLGLDWD